MRVAVPYTVPRQPGGPKAFLLALLVHGLLVVLLAFGVHWKNEVPATLEAEVWDMQMQEAAPEPPPAPVVEAQPPKPEPTPVEPPKPEVKQIPAEDPEIKLAQEKKRKQEQEQRRRQEEERKRLEEKKRLEEEKKRQELERQEKQKKLEMEKQLARERAAAEKARQEAAEKQRREQLEAELRRKAEIERLQSQAGAGGSGAAQRSQGSRGDASYASRLSAKIKSNTTFVTPPDLIGNPAVEYRVELLPDGSVRSIRKLQPSGVPGFDEAVERAIRRSEPYPADNTGNVPSSFIFLHRPKDK